MADEEYGELSLWRDTANIDEARARELVERLERRGRAEDEIAARAAYLDLLGVAPGERVLDVGCGSGVVLRDIAKRVAPDGLAVGLDPSPHFLAAARELAEGEGLADRIELREGDARALPFGDAEFDVALAVTALSHTPEAERAIPEMARIIRPGGRVGVFDLDGDCLIISHPDRALTRRIVAARADHGIVDSWLARRLPGLLAEAGLHDIRVRAFTSLERDPNEFYATWAEAAARQALDSGTITEQEHADWLDTLRVEQAAGRFLAGQTHLFTWATRPLIMMVVDDAEAVAAEPATVTEALPVEAVAAPTPLTPVAR
jgi:ubiquinone/menaquinone biosynthesis C-methylase UbiE